MLVRPVWVPMLSSYTKGWVAGVDFYVVYVSGSRGVEYSVVLAGLAPPVHQTLIVMVGLCHLSLVMNEG